jgi:hypothetical protein
MTSQIADQVVFEGEQYALTAVDGTGLFHPVEHGYEPRSQHRLLPRLRVHVRRRG